LATSNAAYFITQDDSGVAQDGSDFRPTILRYESKAGRSQKEIICCV